MKINEVFTPNDTPTVTYVDRSEHSLEKRLKDFYNTANIVISVSGPSKSGKTVLIKKVVPEDQLITVVGAGVSSAENLWQRVLNWMGAPSQTVVTSGSTTTFGATAGASGKTGIPVVAQGQISGSATGSYASTGSTTETFKPEALPQVIKEIGGSEYVVFIDDFHYIKEEFRDEIGKQIKVAAENGVKIITASVPHRADDVVRSNPELRGRVGAIDISYWTIDELVQIARKGFAALNIDLAPAVEKRFAAEAFGSPQLMQTICLNLCYLLGVSETIANQERYELDESTVTQTLLGTSDFTNFSKMLTQLHTGPRIRGTERKPHNLKDGTKGDVYRAILLSIKEDPGELSFPYDRILSRVKSVCEDETPSGSSITSALEQMHMIGEEVQPGTSPLSWDGDALEITDPYFLFYLRCSEKLQQLAR